VLADHPAIAEVRMTLIGDFRHDVKGALRTIRRRPAFSVLGILTLALGLGATIGLAGALQSVLVRPLPVTDEGSLRVFWGDYDWRGVEYDFLRERTQAFSSLAAYSTDGAMLRTDRGSIVFAAGVTSANLFDVIGAHPAMGRTFAPGEDRPGAEPVVVLSWGVWQQELGADPAIVGKRITLNGRPTTVIGVMPRGFYFPTPELRVWQPLNLDPASGQYQGNGWLVLVGRIGAGKNAAAVNADVAAMATALGQRFSYPAAWDLSKGAHVRPLRDYLVGDVRPALLLLLGAGALILLMACANVAALILARTTDRAHEITLRAALGAGRGRLARQILTESLVFSLVAGAIGLGVAALGFDVLVASLPLKNGVANTVSLDWTAFVIAFVLAMVVGVCVAAVPVRSVLLGRVEGIATTRGVRGLTRGTGRVHAGLVSGESAVAVVLVVGALLLIRSVDQLLHLDLGFEPAGVVATDVVALGQDVNPADRQRLFRELVERSAALPGVVATGMVQRLPVRDNGWQGPVSVESRPDLQGANGPNAMYRPVTIDYFKAMGIELIKGRLFDPSDRIGSPRIGLVSQSFAARAWPGSDPIGQRLRTGVNGDTTPLTVIGVVEEIKIASITGANPFVLYVPLEQQPNLSESEVLVLKTTAGEAATAAAVRRLVREIEPRAAVARVTTMDAVVATALAEPIRLRFFLSLFAGLAVLLGVVGVYSVVSYSVARRQTEFGVRMALGASPTRVLRLVLGYGILPVAIGGVIGLGLAVLLARVASGFLYGVSPADPISMLGAALALMTSGAIAAALPAWRAAGVSPVESLRGE
jgi:predicted permease